MRMNDLIFLKDDLMDFAESARLVVEENNTNDKTTRRMNRALNKYVFIAIKNIKSKAQTRRLIEENPLIDGLLDLYLTAFKAKDFKTIEEAYKKYYDLQKQYPFKENMKMYIHAGCNLVYEGNDIYVSYPAFLYEAYLMNGGKEGANTKDGYFSPAQKLNKEEKARLQKECRSL